MPQVLLLKLDVNAVRVAAELEKEAGKPLRFAAIKKARKNDHF